MKTIKILFILLFPVVLSAQGYIKLINNDFYWDIPEADMGYICQGFGENGPYRYKFNGDTVIDGVTYSKLYYSNFINQNEPPAPNCPPFAVDTSFILQPHIFMREDTIEKKVYRYTTFNGTSEEIILYDFSLEQGDSVHFSDFYPDSYIDTIYDITTYDGVTRKLFEIAPVSELNGGFYIEGIGGAAGLFDVPYYYYEAGYWLMCVKDTDDNPIWSNNSECYDFINGVNDAVTGPVVNIFPNPFISTIYIESAFDRISVRIYNYTGQQELTQDTFYNKKIDVSGLLPGIYLVQVLKGNKVLLSTTMIKI